MLTGELPELSRTSDYIHIVITPVTGDIGDGHRYHQRPWVIITFFSCDNRDTAMIGSLSDWLSARPAPPTAASLAAFMVIHDNFASLKSIASIVSVVY